MSTILTRRHALIGSLATGLLTGCDKVQNSTVGRKILLSGDKVNYALQRAISRRDALAPEYTAAEMSPIFRSNGTSNPGTPDYTAMVANHFADFRLEIGGLVNRPVSLSMDQIKALPARSQITKHDCVEGWTAIGKWHGPLLGTLLKMADVRNTARFIVFHCADMIHGSAYYESIDLIDAFHPQTILAWAMNNHLLSVAHGAPLRLRVERQLGYKQAKYVMRLEAVASLAAIGGGKGGYWEDNVDYDWYAGI